MTYRLALLSGEVDNFKMEIEISSDATFLELNNLIINKLGYSPNEMTSFFMCDDQWERYQEITLIEMDTSSDEDTYTMENTRIEEFLVDEGDKMFYVFDTLNDRGFYVSLREVKYEECGEPRCTKLTGKAPKQINMEEFLNPKSSKKKGKGGDIMDDDDFYGSDGYNDDELDMESFSEVDMSEIDI